MSRLTKFLNVLVPLAILGMTALLLWIRHGFSLSTYPFVVPDSFDWLVNGMAYTPVPTPFSISHRPLLLPLSFAALSLGNLADLIIHWGTIWFAIGSLLTWSLLGRLIPKFEAALVTLLFTLSYFLAGQSAYIGADVAANALLIGSLLSVHLGRVKQQGRWFILGSLLLGLSVHAQYIALLLLPAFAFALFRKSNGQTPQKFQFREIIIALATMALVSLAPLCLRFIRFNLLYSETVQHLSLVRIYSGGFKFYLSALPVAFSLPAVLIALIGVCSAWKRKDLRQTTTLMLAWLLNGFCFFALLYSWMDVRFLIYIALPFFYFTGLGFSALCAILPRYISVPIGGLLFYYVTVTPSPSPFDLSFTVTPARAFVSQQAEWKLISVNSPLYLRSHLEESRWWRNQVALGAVDVDLLSQPLKSLFDELKLNPKLLARRTPIAYFEPLSPERWYITKNLTTLYWGSAVETLDAPRVLCERLRNLPLILIAPNESLSDRSCFPEEATITPLATQGRYIALEIR